LNGDDKNKDMNTMIVYFVILNFVGNSFRRFFLTRVIHTFSQQMVEIIHVRNACEKNTVKQNKKLFVFANQPQTTCMFLFIDIQTIIIYISPHSVIVSLRT